MTATQDLAAAAGGVRPAGVQVHGARKAFGANVPRWRRFCGGMG